MGMLYKNERSLVLYTVLLILTTTGRNIILKSRARKILVKCSIQMYFRIEFML